MNIHECERIIRYLDHLAQIASKDMAHESNTIIGVNLEDFRNTMIEASVTITSFLEERKEYLQKLDAVVTAFIK